MPTPETQERPGRSTAPFRRFAPAVCAAGLPSSAVPGTRPPGSAAVVEGDVVAVGVREGEGAAERPVDGR